MATFSETFLMPAWTPPWTCCGKSNDELVANLKRHGVIRSARVAHAMAAVDRADFVPFADFAYVDAPQRGGGTVVSAPHLHAAAAELLAPALAGSEDGRPKRALDVGCGTGALSAILAILAGPRGEVYATDCCSAAVALTSAACARALPPSAARVVARHVPPEEALGLPQHAPFDAIHVGAALPCGAGPGGAGLPREARGLVRQLSVGGRAVLPTEEQLLLVRRVGPEEGAYEVASVWTAGVGFSPLITSSPGR